MVGIGVIHAVTVERQPQVMYNLTVAVAHTFFVGDGQWLVHNSCGGGTSQVYRAVGDAEFQDLEQVGRFRPAGNSVEGKYFAETPKHAGQWGDKFYGKGNYRVVGAEITDHVPATRWEKLDGIGPARFYDESVLPRIKYKGAIR